MILIAWAFLAMAGSLACSGWIASRKTADRASALYNEGKYAEALPLLTGALQAGERNGTLLYQIGFCHQVVDRKPDEQKSAWTEARALLQKEIAEPGGATLERLYYLTKICSSQDQFDLMTQYARQGVEQYEKGPSANALSGDDWFRIGRLHEFLREDSAAEASYHRAVSAYSKRPDANPTYRALALIRVADYAYDALRLREAAPSYDEALRLLPGTDQIKPFRHALALLAADRFDAAEGVGYEVDLTRPPGERIRNLAFRAAPLEPDRCPSALPGPSRPWSPPPRRGIRRPVPPAP